MGLSSKGAGLVALSTVAATALTLVPQTSLGAGSTTTQASSAVAARAVTNYGFTGSAYGSRVRGGGVPANSGRTALAYIGCTRETGRRDTNSLATVDLGNLGQLNGVKSISRTYRGNGSVNVKSTNTIASAVFLNGNGTSDNLRLEGIKAVARAWHDSNGFHREGRSSLARISLGGVNVPITGRVTNVPGVATITLNGRSGSTGPRGASMTVRAVIVDLDLTGTTVILGNARAKIQDGFVTGVLGGVGIAAKGSLLDGVVRTGKVARQPLPCRGTNGVWKTNKTLGLTVNDLVHLGAATGSARGNQRDRTHGYAQTRGRVARATVGANAQLLIKGVIGAANVAKRGDKLVKSTKGTEIASITFRGNNVRIPTAGNPVKVRNLAVLSAPKVDRSRYGIAVVALRVKVLSGTVGTIDLGIAKASIRPS